jgi:cytochrome c-type biogenesis protein CcmE
MKKSHIIGIVVIAMAIGIILTTAGDASSYVTFEEAKRRESDGDRSKIHVVGRLKKSVTDQVTGIVPMDDQLSFTFVMLDENESEQKVFHPNPIPQDFDRSEQVVVVGSYRKDIFVADKILLKCHSKYQEEEIKI